MANATADAYLSMTSRPARSVAMIAGILLAVASTSAAVLIADTQQAQIDLRFDAQRSGYVMIQARAPQPDGFMPEAVRQIEDLSTVSEAGELSIWRESVPVHTSPFTSVQSVPLVVASSAGLEASGTSSVAGARHNTIDAMPARNAVVWIGATLARRLGIHDRIQAVRIHGRNYTVAGWLQNDSGFEYINNSVVMSSAIGRQHYGNGDLVRLLAKVRPGSASAVGEFVLSALDPTGQQMLVDVTPPDGEVLRGNVAADVRRVGIGLGIFVGMVGMVAVANTLSMAVQQRTRELGLRSAMGFSRARIGSLILLESAMAGLAAALMGAALALLGTYIWTASQGWEIIINPLLAPSVVTAGTAFSVLGGIVPAYRAASVSPLTAMRS